MLTLYRRHRANCKSKSRRAKCFCPIWVQGILRGEEIRKSLDLTNWEAASKLVRDWEIEKPRDIPMVEEAAKRLIADLNSRGLSPDTVKKFELIAGELSAEFPKWLVDRFTPDDLGKFREKWKVKPSTAIKKLERLRSFFKFRVDRHWCERNPAQSLRAPKETTIEKKPYDNDELEKIAWAIPLFPIKGIYGEENRERINAFVSVLRWTGLRIRDVVQLKRSRAFGYPIGRAPVTIANLRKSASATLWRRVSLRRNGLRTWQPIPSAAPWPFTVPVLTHTNRHGVRRPLQFPLPHPNGPPNRTSAGLPRISSSIA